MTETMTFVGLNVQAARTRLARSIRWPPSCAGHVSGREWRRWSGGSRGCRSQRPCGEAGPTDFALYRAAQAPEIALEVAAPSTTPRGSGDRVTTDRRDAELPCRL